MAAAAPHEGAERDERVARALRALEQRDLWPGFRPETVPVAWFDGTRTVLLDHPSPPEGFETRADGMATAPGRHAAIRANTVVELGGVLTAVASLDPRAGDVRAQAALLVHEKFHVYERRQHAAWSANEMALVTYPIDDEAILREIGAEVAALRRAVTSPGAPAKACWAEAALRHREARHRRLRAEWVEYERANELNEGLAAYVQHRALGDDRWATVAAVQPDRVRRVGYFTGHALGRILDDLRPGWRSELDRGDQPTLEAAMAAALRDRPARAACELDRVEARRVRSDAQRLVARLARERARLRAEVSGQTGWVLEFEAPAEAPLWPAGFDPLNVTRVSEREVVHTRWIKLSNDAATIEVQGTPAMTEGLGDHPIAKGIRRLTVASRVEPHVERAGDVATVEVEHVTARVTAPVVERLGRRIVFRIAAPQR